jgi:C4-dicarboxylate-specific signal transduction histidine kinase
MIVNSISDNFFSMDRDGRFTYFNKHAADQMRSLGKDPDALIGKVAWEEFPEAPNKDSFHRVLSERVVVADELYYAPLGEWIENHIYPSNDGGLVTFQRYITRRKQMEEELHKAQAELAHVTRVTTLGELTSSIAHEVNQPLAAIVTNGQASLRLLARSKPDIDEARAAVEAMIGDSMRASEVIKRIRALLKKSGPAKSTLNINDVIREVIALTAEELKKNQVSLATELAPELPMLIGDRIQLQQVMLNLILNGNEAMSSPGWETRDLLLRSEKSEPDRVLVTVQDTGIGFNPKDEERVFDAFFTGKEGGLGLGLSISRTIIEDHGGKLWAKSNEGAGASFQFRLPAAVENQ